MGPFLFLRIIGVDCGRVQIPGRQAGTRRAEQLSHRGFVGVLDFQRTRQRETRWPYLSSRPQSDENRTWKPAQPAVPRPPIARCGLRSRIRSFSRRHAPALQQAGERIVGGDILAAHLQWRIHHEQRPSAAFDVLLNGVHFRLLVVASRAADHQHRAIGRHLGFFQQAEGLSPCTRPCPEDRRNSE